MKIRNFVLLAAMFGTTNVFAVDLLDVYKKALVSDPAFKAARATWLANRENLAISRADLLPQLAAEGFLTRARSSNEIETSSPIKRYNNTSGYTLQLTQSLFNFGSWNKVWGTQALVKKAQAEFMAAEEDLLNRVANAYFNVLQAKDVLAFARANKSSVERLFVQAEHKYDVGLTSITDLEDARKNHYRAIADEVGAVNNLSNALEQLSEITGIKYNDLDSVKAGFPLLSPHPESIERWVKAASLQNFGLMATRYDTIAARENIKTQNAGHLPSLTAQGNYGYQYDDNYQGTGLSDRGKNASASLILSVPILQGGKVVAAAKQADYQYQEKTATEEKTHRSVVSQTRQTYLGILSNISKIKADLQAIKASQSSLQATRANYNAGIRTMADVLTAQSQLYDVQKAFASDEYAYIMNTLKLKALTGILNVGDLKKINSWLEKKTVVETAAKVKKAKTPN